MALIKLNRSSKKVPTAKSTGNKARNTALSLLFSKGTRLSLLKQNPTSKLPMSLVLLTTSNASSPRQPTVFGPSTMDVQVMLQKQTDISDGSEIAVHTVTTTNAELKVEDASQHLLFNQADGCVDLVTPPMPSGYALDETTVDATIQSVEDLPAPERSTAALVNELRELRLAIQAIFKVLVDAAAPKKSASKSARAIDPEVLKSFEGKELLDMTAVETLVGAKRSTIYGWIKAGTFVSPVKLSPKATRFVASDVAAWLDARKQVHIQTGPQA